MATTTIAAPRTCNDDADTGVVPEEWSPIREPPPAAPTQAVDRCSAEEVPADSSDMDTDDDAVVLPVSSKPVATAPGSAPPQDAENCALPGGGASAATEGDPPSKRKRLPQLGMNPVIQVTYEGLTRESRRVLQQALQSWSYWHSRSYGSTMEPRNERLQSGTEVYSPVLALEPTSNFCTISVWMDKPLKRHKGKIQGAPDGSTEDNRDKEKDVPLYDRACVSALSSQDLADCCNGHVAIEEEPSRCFNCGSYTHSLRDCSRPHVLAAIKTARNILQNKRGNTPRSRNNARYYQCSQGGKFDDLKPGLLGLEARKGLGIGMNDPPPWLNRMREVGYPPGYLEDTEDEGSGVQIFDDDTEEVAEKELVDDAKIGEKFSPTVDESMIRKKMIVEHPGVNVSIPENPDKSLWAPLSANQPEEQSRDSKRPFHLMSQVQNTFSGSGLLSPNSPSNSRGLDSRNGSSNIYGAGFNVVNNNVFLSVDPANYWSKRQLSGISHPAVERPDCANPWSGVQVFPHIPSSPSGLASPIRGMFCSPGNMEPLSSPSHIYSRNNYYHSRPQISPLPVVQGTNEYARQAWEQAQAALDALHSSQTSGGLSPSPRGAGVGGRQYSRGSPHQWGRK